MMKELIAAFPGQLIEALDIFRKSTLIQFDRELRNVFISGLGGSGIGGSIVSELVAKECPIPVLVGKDYHIPAWVDKHSLVIISSYSGNTEETLHALNLAIHAEANIICVTSGGEVLRIAQEKGLQHILIPGGNPPRACLGYSLVQLCGIFEKMGLVQELLSRLEHAVRLIQEKNEVILLEAEAIARGISYSLPVLYTSPGYEGVTIRLRQQLNENAKMLCWHHVVPEMNHNELVGWVEKSPKIAAIFLRNEDEYYRTAKRMDIVKDIVYHFAGRTVSIQSQGNNHVERCIYWIHLGDWISWFASAERNVDAMEIDVINRLKNELSSLA